MLGNKEIINYDYSIELIKEIDNKRKAIENNKIAEILMSKICIDLIRNFEEKSQFEDELNEMEEENKGIISDNINTLETVGLNIKEDDFIEDSLDKFYANLIKALIKNKKFENYEFILDKMIEIDIENIYITKTIYDELKEILNKDEIIKEYKIATKEDFNIESKINFYYILLKYIFKNPIYIYDIDFFLDTRKLIINLLRKNEPINKEKNISFNNKITYIIRKLADSDYYFLKKLELVLKYYKEIFFESKKDEIILIEDILNCKKTFDEKFLDDYEEAKVIIKELPIIKYISVEQYQKNATEDEILKAVNTWKKLKEMIKEIKINKMKENDRRIIYNYFKDEKNKEFLNEIFGKDIYNNFILKTKEYYENKNKNSIGQENEKNKKENLDKKTKKNEGESNSDFNLKDNENGDDSSSYYESTMVESKDLNAPGPRKVLNIDISSIENYILKKCNFSLHTNKKGEAPFIEYDDICYGENDLQIKYSRLKEYKEKLFFHPENNGAHNNLKKLFEFMEEMENKLKEQFKNEYMLKINVELIQEKELNEKDKILNITAYFYFFEPLNNTCLKYKEENVLINKTDSNLQGFNYMLYDMNSQKYKNIKYSEEFLKQIECYNKEPEINNINYFAKNDSIFGKTASEFSIIEYIKTLGTTTYSADFIKELSNGYYIIGSQNILTIYDHQFIEKPNLTKKCKDWVYSVCERVLINEKNNDNKNKLEIICCMNSNIGLLEIEDDKSKFTVIETEVKQKTRKKSKEKYDKTKNTYNACIEMRENNYIMAGLRGVVYYKNFFGDKNQISQIKITDKAYKSGIKLNENIVALTSNSVVPEGNDKLIFYNVKSSNLTEGFEGYSFIVSEHNMALIPRSESKSENKILLCACKKYTQGQKNGILLENPQRGSNKRINDPFYETDFEVHCFCPILNVINRNKNLDVVNIDKEYKKNIELEDTNFFLVSAFDSKKREGFIILCKIIIPDKIENTKIKFLQNIEIDNRKDFKGFEGQIKSMIQSRITGNIIITCANGKIYLFTQPNLSLYLKRHR